jgi:GT2 family glycosyltransferase
VGGFDVALDVGTPTNGGGDIEFYYRLVAAGYELRYEPAAMVYHVHRRDEEALKQQIYNNGRAFAAYLLTIARNEPQKRLAVFRFALRWWIWGWLSQQLYNSLFKKEHRWALSLAVAEVKGSFSSIPAYRRAQQLARKLKAGQPQPGLTISVSGKMAE